MPATTDTLTCEVQKAPNDAQGNAVTIVKCHGRLVSATAGELKEVVKPLIPLGGKILIDLGDVSYMDSTGLGSLVALKVSAVNQGMVILETVNVTPRILELLRITKLAQLLSPGQS
jgi:anti-anti-sigma factor